MAIYLKEGNHLDLNKIINKFLHPRSRVYCHLGHRGRRDISHYAKRKDSGSKLCGASVVKSFEESRNPKLLCQPIQYFKFQIQIKMEEVTVSKEKYFSNNLPRIPCESFVH